MTTITIQASNEYADKIYAKLKADKNIDKVVIKKSGKKNTADENEIALTMPGKPVKEDELLNSLVRASRGKNLSLSKARLQTRNKIAAWRKSK